MAGTGRFPLEERFDALFVARLALREKQVQQSYRPIISIHKWLARRLGSVFRGLLLSEFGEGGLRDAYRRPNSVRGILADPFMGGGTTVFESLRPGLGVVGRDLNPMAYRLVRQAVEPIDVDSFVDVGRHLWSTLVDRSGPLYRTRCLVCDDSADVKYFLWGRTCPCPDRGSQLPLFPGYRVAEAVRHPREVFHRPSCEELHETERGAPRVCPKCDRSLAAGNTSRGGTRCLSCDHEFPFSGQLGAPPEHRLLAVEYHCRSCYGSAAGRRFKSPGPDDLARVEEARTLLARDGDTLGIPDDVVPRGDETDRLHRWGHHRYRDMFNDRQLLGLGDLMDLITGVPDSRVRHALATVFSDFLRYLSCPRVLRPPGRR